MNSPFVNIMKWNVVFWKIVHVSASFVAVSQRRQFLLQKKMFSVETTNQLNRIAILSHCCSDFYGSWKGKTQSFFWSMQNLYFIIIISRIWICWRCFSGPGDLLLDEWQRFDFVMCVVMLAVNSSQPMGWLHNHRNQSSLPCRSLVLDCIPSLTFQRNMNSSWLWVWFVKLLTWVVSNVNCKFLMEVEQFLYENLA